MFEAGLFILRLTMMSYTRIDTLNTIQYSTPIAPGCAATASGNELELVPAGCEAYLHVDGWRRRNTKPLIGLQLLHIHALRRSCSRGSLDRVKPHLLQTSPSVQSSSWSAWPSRLARWSYCKRAHLSRDHDVGVLMSNRVAAIGAFGYEQTSEPW